MAKMSDWKHLGTLGVIQNVVAETTVDATFRKVEAFNTKLGENGMALDLVNNTITIAETGTYQFIGTTKFEGSVKVFEFQLFIDGEPSGLIASDRGNGDAAVSGFLDLVAGEVIDVRQRSSDGGTALTIETMTVSLERMY